MKKTMIFSIILIGLTAMASQIVFVREFLIIFYGNELSMGFILSGWLAGGAIGSAVFGRYADKVRAKIAAFAICQLAIAILLPLDVLAIRSIKYALGVNAGEVVGLFPMAVSSLVIFAPTCMVFGFMFSLGCRIYGSEEKSAAQSIGRVYILETAGAIIGGLLVSFILIRALNSTQIIGVMSLLNTTAAFLCCRFIKEKRERGIALAASVAGILFAAGMFILNGWGSLDKYSLRLEWRGHELVVSRNSIYGNVAVTKRLGGISFFDNGLHLFTVPDQATSEEATHFALLEHPDPRDVLLIGGGAGGLVKESLKHPVERIDYVELDPLIIEMAREHLPEQDSLPLENAKVSVKNMDGRLFVKTAQSGYDAIIMHLGDPCNAQLNRYYTLEFFREIKRILKKGGVASFSLRSSEDYINKELAVFLRSIYATLKEVFCDIKVMPGPTAYFLVSDDKGRLTYDYRILMDRARARKLELEYVREYYLFSRLSPQRIRYVEDLIKDTRGVSINYDLMPMGYYYDMIFWTTYFRESLFSGVLKAATADNIRKIIYAVCAFIIFFAFAAAGQRKSFRHVILLSVMMTGFGMLAFQMIVLLSFQIIYGYMFYRLGVMLSAFMAGMALGGWCIVGMMPAIKKEKPVFIRTQGAVSVYAVILMLVLKYLAGARAAALPWLGPDILFPILSIAAGFIGGFQFPLAAGIYLGEGKGIGKAAGLNYGVDLLGSCLGALLTGSFLIPVIGISGSCLAIAGMNLAVTISIILNKRA